MTGSTKIAVIEAGVKPEILEQFVHDVGVHSGQDVVLTHENGLPTLHCQQDQNVAHAENSVRMLRSYLPKHVYLAGEQ